MRHFATPRGIRAAAVLAVAFACAGCGSDSFTEPDVSATGPIELTPSSSHVFIGDTFDVHATVRDANGHEVPGAAVTFSSADTSLALVNDDGHVTAIGLGTARIVAHSGALSGELKIVVHDLAVSSVAVVGLPDTLASGDVLVFGVHVLGEGGRTIFGRQVKLASSNPAVAVIDPSGRVRAVSAGTTTISATADGVVGKAPLVVSADPAVLQLRGSDGQRVPSLVEGDSLSSDGVIDYREIYLESGTLQLTGGTHPAYQTSLHYAWYSVTFDGNGQRHFRFLSALDLADHGTVHYDARGDLVMQSLAANLSHDATTEANGLAVHYRFVQNVAVPPTLLFFRREPK